MCTFTKTIFLLISVIGILLKTGRARFFLFCRGGALCNRSNSTKKLFKTKRSSRYKSFTVCLLKDTALRLEKVYDTVQRNKSDELSFSLFIFSNPFKTTKSGSPGYGVCRFLHGAALLQIVYTLAVKTAFFDRPAEVY